MKLINIGFGNMVNANRLVAIVSPESAPIKRIIQDCKERGTLIDATHGRRTRAVIITDSDHVILTYLQSETVANRLNNDGDELDIEEEESDGIHYYFVDKDYFMRKIEEGQVLEYAQYGINYYGTPKAPVDELLAQGRTVFLKIEVQGAEKIRKLYPEAVSIFLMPPSMAALEERLRCRESEDEEDIQRRLTIAVDEIKRAVEYDYIVINDIVSYAVSDICTILDAEKQKTFRCKNIISEVINNV